MANEVERRTQEKPATTWQERVLDERKDLTYKIEALARFLFKMDSNDSRFGILNRQFNAMITYQGILDERIAQF
jgi:hypothetical protein